MTSVKSYAYNKISRGSGQLAHQTNKENDERCSNKMVGTVSLTKKNVVQLRVVARRKATTTSQMPHNDDDVRWMERSLKSKV